MKEIVLLAHNIRSTHNVGAFFRTAEGFGVSHVYLTGYTPYPLTAKDTRLPHEAQRLTKQIHKTALGAETIVPFSYSADPLPLINELRANQFAIVALEQTPESIPLPDFAPQQKRIALILGEEVNGIAPEILKECETAIEIPMQGKKESFNVSVACGIALYALRQVPLL